MKRLIAILLLIFLVFSFTSCYDIKEISYKVAAVALGIDKGENMKYRVSFHIEKTENEGENSQSKDTSKEDGEKGVVSAEAQTIAGALRRVNEVTATEISVENLKMVILSEDICKENIFDPIKEMMYDTDIKNNAYVIVSKGKAEDILKSIKPEEEEYLSIFYQRILYNLYKTNIKYFLMEEVYFNILSYPGQDIILPLASKIAEEKTEDKSQEKTPITTGAMIKSDSGKVDFSGGAAFKEDRLFKFLSEKEMAVISLLYGYFKERKISIEYPENSGNYTVVEVRQESKPSYKTYIEDKNIKEDIFISLKGHCVFTENDDIDIFHKEFIPYFKYELEELCEKVIKEIVINKVDLISTGKRLRKCFYTNEDYRNYDYMNHLEKGSYNVVVELDIKSGGRMASK